MTAMLSTGYCDAIHGPQSFESIFRYGVIEIRAGQQPPSADAAASGTLLARITREGGLWTPGNPANGLEFQHSGRYAFKHIEHTWRLIGLANGVAGWFRLKGNAADAGDPSTTLPRIDGSIGIVDSGDLAEMFLLSTGITNGMNEVVPHWLYAIPPL